MAISQAVCNTFKRDLLKGFHDFANGGSTFKIALFTSSASLGASTEDYSTSNETSGTGYVAGGETLTNQSVTGGTAASTAYVDWATDPQWTSASFTANGAIIYNTTTDGGTGTTDAVCVLAFGADYTATNGTFTVQFPAPGTSTAILRLSQGFNMALVINDRVKETTTTTGTGTVNLAGASDGFQTFVAGIGTTNTTYYCITMQSGTTAYEIGIGTVTDASPDTLSRDTVLESTNSDNKVDFAAGAKDVFCTYPAKRAPSPVMDPTAYVTTHNSTISDVQTMDSGVLAGPVSITGTLSVTGNLFIL